jgi:hypothetical protein
MILSPFGMMQCMSRVVVKISVVDSFRDPEPAFAVYVNIRWIVEHGRLCPQRGFEIVGQIQQGRFVLARFAPS